MSDSLQASNTSCPECQVGKYQLKLVTYYTYLGTELITVPDFPCWVCDVCKRQDYDQKALSQVYMMLSSNLGKPVERGRKNKTAKMTGPQSRRAQQSNK